ncbi:TIGR02186 family protein [Xanthobacter sp. V4C-4]|uniref:TIGR02186 family protein n=1 Tax=Xanthobacter cornucopiae TaxID=3119924 RepID=UPI00372776BA
MSGRRRWPAARLARAAALAAGLHALPAQAQPAETAPAPDRLVVSISQPRVRITSSFTGTELVVFGVAETSAPDDSPDVVVTVRGPKESFITWRKSRLFGLWVNTDSRTFIDVPAFLSVQSNRPPEEMAPPEVLRVEQIGLTRNVLVQMIGTDYADVVPTDPFRLAFLRTQEAEQLYQENPRGVVFLAPRVFRADFAIPGRAPLGHYDISVKLLREGRVTAQSLLHFEVNKTGFEQEVAAFAQTNALFYGIVVAIGSLIIGFIGNFLFRKE